MAGIILSCPKCSNRCEFEESRLFGFCNKCGSNLERKSDGTVSVYDKTQEKDPYVTMAAERFDVCSKVKIPTRAEYDFESFDSQIELVMDELMSFTETLKDVLSAKDEMEPDTKLRTLGLCYDMNVRLFRQYESFLKEYMDYGMYDEFKNLDSAYSKELQALTANFVSEQRKQTEEYWADKQDEYKRLTEALRDAKNRRSKLAFLDFQNKWDVDAEIEELEKQLSVSNKK